MDSTEAAVQISRFDLLTYLVSTAEKGKHEGVPVLNMSGARIESAVESVNRVIMAPGKYRVRFLMAIWNPYLDGKILIAAFYGVSLKRKIMICSL